MCTRESNCLREDRCAPRRGGHNLFKCVSTKPNNITYYTYSNNNNNK